MTQGFPIKGAVILITGANRGIGRALVTSALQRGARKVYAAMRTVRPLGLPGVEEIALDVTDEARVRAAATDCGDVCVLINNAGIAETGGFLAEGSLAACQRTWTPTSSASCAWRRPLHRCWPPTAAARCSTCSRWPAG